MTRRTLMVVAGVACGALGLAWGQEPIPLKLGEVRHNVEWRDLGGGQYEIVATGFDPYVLCEPLEVDYDPAQYEVVSFDIRCPQGLDSAEVFLITTRSGWRNVTLGPVKASDDWQPIAAQAATTAAEEWDGKARQFRLDLGSEGGTTVQIRNLTLRPMSRKEVEARDAAAERERQRIAAIAAKVESSLIAPAKLPPMPDMISETQVLRDDLGVTAVAVIGRELDLVSLVDDMAGQVKAPVPLGPALVAGEGANPVNHTLVRVYSRYGVCQAQFLAYPPEVTGGVQVEAGCDAEGNTRIVTAPLSGVEDAVRVYSRYGRLAGELAPGAEVRPPYAITVGDLAPATPGDEVAVTSAQAAGDALPLVVMGLDGAVVARLAVPLQGHERGPVTLTADREGRLLVSVAGSDGYYCGRISEPGLQRVTGALEAGDRGVFPSAFEDQPLAVTADGGPASTLRRLAAEGAGAVTLDVGTRENLFWFTAVGAFGQVPEGRYTKHSLFAHLRTDFASPVASTPDFGRSDEEFWAGEPFRAWTRARLASYDTDPPTCWEPCFTHRWFTGQAKAWSDAVDPETGLPAYTLVDRENRTGYYGEFGQTNAFVSGTYAPGVGPIECLYTLPLRTFLRELSRRFRSNPEHFVAVEPNHEMEINAESQETHGDYNPNMIRGFYRYLTGLYGGLEGINRVFGTPFSAERFDAPRDLGRGNWDRYSADNPYYLVWMRYMNYCIYRVVAGTYREALLAGFPPEAIKCHQIPDNYAISSLTAFSKPAQRVTPIDWNLNAGVGFGFTRYGVWYRDRYNAVQGPHSSGFDSMVIGEYQSLTPDAEAAYGQLGYMRDHGVQFIHCMNWPAEFDQGFNASLAEGLERLVADDRPRPGVTGGTGQVRPWDGGECDLVSLGTGPDRTGLIKSVREDGSWEGSVYLVPFHAAVEASALASEGQVEMQGEPVRVGPLEGIDSGNLVEITLRARSRTPEGAVSVRVLHHGIELPALRLVLPVGEGWQDLRAQVRVQADLDDLALEIGSGDAAAGTWLRGDVEVADLKVVRHREQTLKLKKGVLEGRRHGGGVTFDILPEQD